MKNYTITVNGNVYDVTVEEGGAGAPAVRPAAAAPKAAPAAAPKAAAPAGGAGAVKLEAKAAGKVFAIEASVGQAVKAEEIWNDISIDKDTIMKVYEFLLNNFK